MDLALYSLPFLWQGTLITLGISAVVTALSLVLGTLLGTLACYGPLLVRWAIRLLYCDVIRGIPVLVLIFTIYYGLPLLLGFEINSFVTAVVALTVFTTAQVTEIARGAIQSIHFGQIEAGKAIGLGFWPRVLYVVFPQAIRRFLPPWVNNLTDVVKGSALISLVGIVELMLQIKQVAGRVYIPMPIYIVGTIIYFLINYSLSSASRKLEGRFAHIRE
jgi:polar amino acid transport system permease protein